jgi:hypothetical protein
MFKYFVVVQTYYGITEVTANTLVGKKQTFISKSAFLKNKHLKVECNFEKVSKVSSIFNCVNLSAHVTVKNVEAFHCSEGKSPGSLN